MSFLEINNLDIQYKTRKETINASRDVTFNLERGEILGIVGESGSGKSTVANAIINLIDKPGKITNGSIKLDNIECCNNEKIIQTIRGNKIGFVFQDPQTSLNPLFKIKDQLIETIQTHLKLSYYDAKKRSIELLQEVGIENPEKRINEYPHQFSGGMRQRVMIAMALQCNPSLLIADEPTTALDVTIQAQILDLMMSLKDKRDDAAILLITHDLAVVAETCDRVIVMYGGKIQEIAEINELFSNPLHPYTKALMNSIPKMEKKENRLRALKGMVPSIIDMDDGCKFCNRFNEKDCPCYGTKENQELFEAKPGHFVRCHKEMI